MKKKERKKETERKNQKKKDTKIEKGHNTMSTTLHGFDRV